MPRASSLYESFSIALKRTRGREPLIPHSRPTFSKADIRAVTSVLGSGYIAQGKRVAAFEEKMADFLKVRGGVATSSGTAALHLALLCVGAGEGNEIIIPSYVCSAVLHAVSYVRASPRLVDCDPLTFNMAVSGVKKVLGRKTKAIIVPHLFGQAADIKELLELGVPIIEDCAQSLGALYLGRPVGSFGVISILSFYATKVMTTGEGGMLLSNSQEILEKARDLQAYDEKQRYRTRFNYKMTDLQAALGLSQLRRLPTFLAEREAIAERYRAGLDGLPLALPEPSPHRTHIYYRYVVMLQGQTARVARRLQSAGIMARRPVFCPLHKHLSLSGFPGANEAWGRALSLPIYPSLANRQVHRIIDAMRETAGKGLELS